MKKSLIALAVMAAAGAASAQSSVQLYGLADIWFGSAKSESRTYDPIEDTFTSSSVRNTKLDSGGVNISRWGVKGSEDLGGGLKANFQLEQSIALDTGDSGSFDRQSWVGVSGGFGQVQAGKVWTSYDDVQSSNIDSFGAIVSATYSAWIGAAFRIGSAIKYTSPNFDGFSGSLTYGFGEDKVAGQKASNLVAVGLQYANGPVSVGFAHQTEKSGNGTTGVTPAGVGALNARFGLIGEELTAGVGDKLEANLINGSYNFGVAKLIAAYNQVKATSATDAGSIKAKEYTIGVEVPLAANLNLGAGYAESKIEGNGQDLFKTTAFNAALVYSLSKRTNVYGALNQTKTDDEFGLGVSSKSTLYAVGINQIGRAHV